jgi:hypothetical protein
MEDKTKFYFTKVPARLLRAHTLLDHIDRGLLAQIASYHPNPCFLPVDYLTSVVLGCGEKAFYRAVFKLDLLGLISFEKNGKRSPTRKRPNHYTFNADPSLWRLPRPLSDEIKADFSKLGQGELVYKNDPFDHEFAFKIYFNKKYPKYQVQAKNRSVSNLTGTPVRCEIDPADLPWFERLNEIKNQELTPERILTDYYKNKLNIQSLSTLGELIGFNQRKYLIDLKDRYMQVTVNPPTEAVAKLVALVEGLEKNGATRGEISIALATALAASKTTSSDEN